MEAGIKIGLHNRFDIEVRDAITGELKNQATAYNIVLDALWTRLLARSAFMSAIHIGTGTGTLSPTRTSLFTFLVAKSVTLDGTGFGLSNMYRRVKIQLGPAEYVGSVITEVGVAYGTSSGNLCTHAMLTDSEGNPITIEKTSTDVVIIYATVFFTVSELPSYVTLTGVSYTGDVQANKTLSYMINQSGSIETNIRVGSYADTAVTTMQPNLRGREIATKTVSFTTDVATKKLIFPVRRFEVAEANDHIQEFGIGGSFNVQLPNENYIGTQYDDIILTGQNGTVTDFILPSSNIDVETIVVKINNVETSVTAIELPYYKQYVPTGGQSNFTFQDDDSGVQYGGYSYNWDGVQFIRDSENDLAVGSRTLTRAHRAFDCLVALDGVNIRIYSIPTGTPVVGWDWGHDNGYLYKVAEDVFIWAGYSSFGQQSGAYTIYTLDEGITWQSLSGGSYSRSVTNCASNVKRINTYGTDYRKFNTSTPGWSTVTVTNKTSHTLRCFTSDDSIMLSFGTVAGIASYHEVDDLTWEKDNIITSTDDTLIYTAAWFINDNWLIACNATVATIWHLEDSTWKRVFYNIPRTNLLDFTWTPSAQTASISPLGTKVQNGNMALLSTGKYAIRFAVPPTTEDEIKVSYKVNGIHKTSNYVLDVSGYIQFGE